MLPDELVVNVPPARFCPSWPCNHSAKHNMRNKRLKLPGLFPNSYCFLPFVVFFWDISFQAFWDWEAQQNKKYQRHAIPGLLQLLLLNLVAIGIQKQYIPQSCRGHTIKENKTQKIMESQIIDGTSLRVRPINNFSAIVLDQLVQSLIHLLL